MRHMMRDTTLGLIVNPIAGMGGSVGLKGTDGDLVTQARALGAVALAAGRAKIALSQLVGAGKKPRVLTCSGVMGADVARGCGFEISILHRIGKGATGAADSRAAARAIAARKPDLLLFVGGDGTARDLLPIVGTTTPILGVPSGVKMHSAVFAATARAAGQVAREFLDAANRESMLRDAEVMDRDRSADAATAPSPRLFGIVRTPSLSFLVPGAKSASRVTDQQALAGAVRRVAGLLRDKHISLLGPGSTMQQVKRACGFAGTALGVDAVQEGRRLALDLNEAGILDLVEEFPARLVMGVIGGQGFLFGRGNQQFSGRVIRRVGIENLTVLSSMEKLMALPGRRLLVDTGDAGLDRLLRGFIRVSVGAKRTLLMPVESG